MTSPFPLSGSIFDLETEEFLDSQELLALIASRKTLLFDSGVQKNDWVALQAIGGKEFAVNFFALWEIGACIIPVAEAFKENDKQEIFSLCRPDFYLATGQLIKLDRLTSHVKKSEAKLILVTSGSTGRPKAVMHSQETVMFRIHSIQRQIPAHCLQKVLCMLPLHFAHGLISNFLLTLASGGTLCMNPSRKNQDPMFRVGELIDRHEITFFSAVPSIWSMVSRMAKPPQKNSLKRVHSASDSLLMSTWVGMRRWLPSTAKIFNTYGTTETASWVAGADISLEYCEGMVGEPWDADFSVTGQGEVIVKTGSLSIGYFGDAEASADAFVEKALYTGDLGKIENGRLSILGRNHELIHRAGVKIHPREVESAVLAHPGLSDACAFSFPHPISGEGVGVAIVMRGPEIESAELQRWCEARLPAFKLPDRWYRLSEIPRSIRGKVNRTSVRELCLKK